MILQQADKSNNNLNRRLMGEFRSLVSDLELREIKLKGRKFTWSNDVTQTIELIEPSVQLSGSVCSQILFYRHYLQWCLSIVLCC
jgi:hypothetical protein